MTSSIYEAIDLLEVVTSGGEEDEILTTAGNILCLVGWAHIQTIEAPGCVEFLPWLYTEARKYEASIDDGSAAEDA